MAFFQAGASIKSESFREYADMEMIPLHFIERQLATTKRVDVILNLYLPDSIKATTRQGSKNQIADAT